MRKVFDPDNFLWAALAKGVDVVGLSIAWLLLCLPVVTIGPASAALYYTVVKCLRQKEKRTFGVFFRAFRDSLKQGVLATLICLPVAAALAFGYVVMEANRGAPLGAVMFVAYDVALLAKHKDLRNKNTGMNFRVAPGLHWQGGNFGAGFDLGYERGTEKVEYSQESSSVEHVLFAIYGLWVGQGYGFASAETKRLKENDRFFGDLQTDLRIGSAVLHNNFRLAWKREMQTETGYNNLQHGTVRTWEWRDDLSLAIGRFHQVEAGISWTTMQGFRPLQQQELDPDSKIRIWKTYGDPVFCYFREYDKEYVRYSFGPSWKVSVGADNFRLHHSYTEYPQRFEQRVSYVTPYVGMDLPLGSAWLLSAHVGYTYSYEEMHDTTKWQIPGPLQQQIRFWTGNSVSGRLAACWSHGRMTLGMDYGFAAATTFDGFRHTGSLTAGFAF
mgnify:CR=1 FL=1